MNALVVNFSKFGNTQLLAETIAESLVGALGSEGAVRLVSAGELEVKDFDGVDLVIMGTPTHNMNLPQAVRPLFDSFPRKMLKGVKVAAFDTSYEMSGLLNRFTASKKLDKKLRKLGGARLVPPEIFIVEGREGPLRAGEIERAKQWAKLILERALSALGN